MHTYWEKMWSFETENLRIVWEIAPEEHPDFSFDESGETAEKCADGTWQCFMSRMRVIHKGTGGTLGEDHLGNSIYENPSEFRDHIGARGRYGSYFRDMVGTAVREARKTLRALQSIPIRAGA